MYVSYSGQEIEPQQTHRPSPRLSLSLSLVQSLGSTATGTAANIVHNIGSADFAPGPVDGKTIVVFVTGSLKIDDGNPLQFAQVMQLVSTGSSWVIKNDMFRFVYGS